MLTALTHVLMVGENGWEKATVEKASFIYPNTVSADSGIFMCDLCGQPVAFSRGGKKARYFKHKKDVDARCDEKVQCKDKRKFLLDRIELPLRIKLNEYNGFTLEIGIINNEHYNYFNSTGTIEIVLRGISNKIYVYNFNRLENNIVNYLPVGDKIASSYDIFINSNFCKCDYCVDGIKETAIFNSETGKRLVENSDIIVGKKYYIISKRDYFDFTDECNLKKILHNNGWNLFEFQVDRFTEENIRSIYRNFLMQLTNINSNIKMVWPLVIKRPYLIQVNKEQVWIYCKSVGSITFNVYPVSSNNNSYNEWHNNEDHVFSTSIGNKQQLIALGRYSNLLQYTYIEKRNLCIENTLPTILVCDMNDKVIYPGDSTKLPHKRRIKVKAPFDCRIVKVRKGGIIKSLDVKAEQLQIIDDIRYDDIIKVYIGLDIVWTKKYAKKINLKIDKDIVHKLNCCKGENVIVTKDVIFLADKLHGYPEVKQWLYKQYRKGFIDNKALDFLKKELI